MTQSEAPQLVGSEQLAPLLQAAAASTRKRSHLLLHADQQDRVQRLLIALEPESYVRPHVHGEQWEMIVLLRGRFDFLIFDPQAELVQRLAMSIASPVVQIPRGAWHLSCAQAITQERKRLTAGEILRRLARLRMTPLCAIAPDKLAEMELRIVFRRLSFYTLHKSRITIHSLP